MLQTGERKKRYIFFLLGTLAWTAAVLWVNFHSAQWYNFDMYADASVAKRMAEQNTFFPENWIFGNQYYIIASPAIASLFYHVFHNSVLAMSCAASLMFVLILLCYAWFTRPLFSEKARWAGIFCMAGATILGDSISSSTYGFQILYTMAAYYACYLLVIVIHLGIWIRLRREIKVSKVVLILALIGSFTLGLQSPREMLSLCIPLFLITGLMWLLHKIERGERKSFLFAVSSIVANFLGMCGNRMIKQHWGSSYLSNVNTVGSNGAGATLPDKIRESCGAFLDLVGMRYFDYSWKWKPLAVLGMLLLCAAAAALLIGLRKQNRMKDPMLPLAFCWISLLGVFAAGILMIQVRSIYYFVWYLLVPISVSFLCDILQGRGKTILCFGIIFLGAMNFFYSLYPDVSKYREQKQFFSETVSWLEEREISTVYGDYQTPTIAACSEDRLDFCSVFPNAGAKGEGKNGILIPNGSPVATEHYQNVDPVHSVLILSDSPYDEMSGYRFLNAHTSEEFRELFEEIFTQEACFASSQITYYVYSFSEPDLFPDENIF